MKKMTAKNIIGAIGRDVVAARLDVKRTTVNKAYNDGPDGSMPASWYAAVKQMGESLGFSVPMSAFNWKSPPPFDVYGEPLNVTDMSA